LRPLLCALLVLTAGSACSRPAGTLEISLDPSSVIRVRGLSSAELSALRAAAWDDSAWRALLSVRVAGASSDAPPVSGRYAVTGDAVEFTPAFPFDPGRRYDVAFDPSRLPVPRGEGLARATVAHPAADPAPPTRVLRLLPTADVVPENLLRVYLEFSGPMSRESGREFVALFDELGREVPDAFLALDVEFWSRDYRRYTLFFDPGRVKRGILPNEHLGRALDAGRRYTIRVDPRWRDANGQPLAGPFEQSFTVGPADMAPLATAAWDVRPPAAGTREPLVVTFPKPLDHGLLQRAIGVSAANGDAMDGSIQVGAQERTWSFTPVEAWRAGPYVLIALDSLEDPAGNRIGRPFDVDRFERVDPSPIPERFEVPFDIE
jgi:hypothetical protein